MAKRNGNRGNSRAGGRLRIIGGQWRSRQLPFPDVEGLRPTTDRVRETLFNWIQHDIPGARCLDLFSGSGALGFEALSRGAGNVVMIENNSKASFQLKENAKTLNAENVEIYHGDAMQFLSQENTPFDLIFLDPPFGKGFLQDCINQIVEMKLLKKDGAIYIESEQSLDDLEIPANWHPHREKQAGQVIYRLYVVEENWLSEEVINQ